MKTSKLQRRIMAKRRLDRATEFEEIPPSKWPIIGGHSTRRSVWLSRDYLVQLFDESDGVQRLSICSTVHTGDTWADGIKWDDLQAIKNAVGFADRVAVEVYPESDQVVNVANMRHLFLLPGRPAFAWRKV